MNSSQFHLDNDKDDFPDHAEKGLMSDRLHNRSLLNSNHRTAEPIDFNRVHNLKDIKDDVGHQSGMRPSEVSQKLGLDSSMAMSNQLKNFDDFGDESEVGKKEDNENLDSDENDDSP